ncbi:MAG: hypothetical protein ACLT2T_00440 [Bilophila wadsworthia]
MFYVGLTRAQDAVSSAMRRSAISTARHWNCLLSRFLSALPELFRHTRLVRHVCRRKLRR